MLSSEDEYEPSVSSESYDDDDDLEYDTESSEDRKRHRDETRKLEGTVTKYEFAFNVLGLNPFLKYFRV